MRTFDICAPGTEQSPDFGPRRTGAVRRPPGGTPGLVTRPSRRALPDRRTSGAAHDEREEEQVHHFLQIRFGRRAVDHEEVVQDQDDREPDQPVGEVDGRVDLAATGGPLQDRTHPVTTRAPAAGGQVRRQVRVPSVLGGEHLPNGRE